MGRVNKPAGEFLLFAALSATNDLTNDLKEHLNASFVPSRYTKQKRTGDVFSLEPQHFQTTINHREPPGWMDGSSPHRDGENKTNGPLLNLRRSPSNSRPTTGQSKPAVAERDGGDSIDSIEVAAPHASRGSSARRRAPPIRLGSEQASLGTRSLAAASLEKPLK